MTWIRGPWWDGFWILSGLPIGMVMMLFVSNPHVRPIVITVMVLETAHVVSPVILAWSKPGLRRIVRHEWRKHIAAPAGLMAGCLLLPWSMVFGIYFAWNIWHFGMQIFGITCLYRPLSRPSERVLRALGCLVVTVLGMGILPFLGGGSRLDMFAFGIFSFNHWLVDIGLSSQVSGWRWKFLPIVLLLGVIWFLLRQGPLSVHVVPQILAIRAGIGMIHFVYSARVWKLSDPQVRAAIGKDLFACKV